MRNVTLTMYAIHWHVQEAETGDTVNSWVSLGRVFPTHRMARQQAEIGIKELLAAADDEGWAYSYEIVPVNPPIVDPAKG